jgi:hypothetical protein
MNVDGGYISADTDVSAFVRTSVLPRGQPAKFAQTRARIRADGLLLQLHFYFTYNFKEEVKPFVLKKLHIKDICFVFDKHYNCNSTSSNKFTK